MTTPWLVCLTLRPLSGLRQSIVLVGGVDFAYCPVAYRTRQQRAFIDTLHRNQAAGETAATALTSSPQQRRHAVRGVHRRVWSCCSDDTLLVVLKCSVRVSLSGLMFGFGFGFGLGLGVYDSVRVSSRVKSL